MIYKRIKNKKIRIFLIALTCVLCVPIAYWLILYLAMPRYQFKEGQPFHGEYLYNPYQEMNPNHWKAYNFRSDTINNKSSKYHVSVYEHGYGFFNKTHQLCIGKESVCIADFPFVQNLEIKQHMLNMLKDHTRFAVPAHASYSNGYKVSDMRYLDGYRLLEIGNPDGTAFEHWDAALSSGHRVYGIGNDDTEERPGRFLTMINTATADPEEVYDALERGCAYTIESKKPATLQHLTCCELSGDTLLITASDSIIAKAEFIGQGGKVLETQHHVNQAVYKIQPEDNYVRVKLQFPDQNCFYLNPITRQTNPTPTDQQTAEINWPLTILYYIIYVIVIIACIWRIAKRH